MQLGSAVHAYIERELLGRPQPSDIDANAKRIAEAGRKYWPVDDEMFVEMEIQLDAPSPGFVGFIDVYLPEKGEIVDHKTVGNWNYALTEQRLAFDPQMIIYAKSVNLDQVRLTHLQYGTKGRAECRRISVVVNREHIDKEFAKIASVVEVMRPLATTEIRSVDVEANRGHCSAYGGCPYLRICKSVTGEKIRPFAAFNKPTNQENEMSKLADLLEKRRRGASINKPKVEVVPIELEDERETAPEIEEVPPLLARVEEEPKSKSKSEKYDYSAAATMLIERDVSTTKEIKDALKEHWNAKRLRKSHIDAAIAASDGAINVSEDGSVQVSLEVDRGMGVESCEETETLAILPDEIVEAIPNAPETIEENGVLRLFVDCLPVGEAVSNLPEFLFPFVAAVAAENGGLDPLLMEYGKGTRQVAAKLDNASNSISGAVYVDSRNPYWPCVSIVLESVATSVVRGVR